MPEPKDQKKADQITIPEDLSTLSDKDLEALHDTAVEAFKAMLPEEGDAPDDTALESLAALAEGVEAIKGEVATRDQAALARSGKAKDLADKVLGAAPVAQDVSDEEAAAAAEEDAADGGADDAEENPDGSKKDDKPADLVASAEEKQQPRRGPININLGDLRRDRPAPKDEDSVSKPVKIALAAQGAAGFDVGKPMSMRDMATSINSRLGGFNAASYAAARQRGRKQSERFTIARLPREFAEGAVVQSEDPTDAMKFATDEKRLPKKSLVASGGWCAPSETLYDLVDISEAANLVSVPEIQINRGGIRYTIGPDYREVFADTGFCYTEQEDIDGDYDGAGGGTKPCVTVPCPDFDEVRLGYCGVCIGAGLLQQRGYPEVIEDYVGKTLNAHAHRVSASVVNSMVAQSSAVVFPGPQAGATAPLLSAIDLQATHYRAVNRMADDASLEIILPTWIQVAIRADLARRQGVDLLDVPQSRVNAWFAARNVNAQYVVDWQDIATTAASGFTAAPTGVSFLLYAAGTFVKGVTDSITLENIYDSVLLGTNDFTALFTEDPYLVAKRNHDSRVVTVPITPDGATHVGIAIAGNGTGS